MRFYAAKHFAFMLTIFSLFWRVTQKHYHNEIFSSGFLKTVEHSCISSVLRPKRLTAESLIAAGKLLCKAFAIQSQRDPIY